VPAWVLWGNDLIDRALLVVMVSLLWILTSALGLVVLGVAPATCAGADLLRDRREGRHVRVLAGWWGGVRREVVRANVRMLPLMVVQVSAVMTLWLAFQRGSTPGGVIAIGVAAIVLVWVTAAVAAIVACARLRRQEVLVTWRVTLLLPGALPVRSLLQLVLTGAWSLLCVAAPPLAVMLGAGVALDLCGAVLARPIDALLAQVDESSAETDQGTDDGAAPAR